MTNLAINGGKPEIKESLTKYRSMSKAEKDAVCKVIDSDCLSGFYGSWEEGFLGGPRIQEFEKEWSKKFGVKYTVSVNSNTSGLYCAMGAVGISPGDEVIVPCTTMSATSMAPLIYGGIPVFADIEDETYCLDKKKVESLITEKTKAIIAVNLFGHPAELKNLRRLADDNNIFLIEDNAQSPLAKESDCYTGTIGHIGVFSLNYHKHVHTGEGGMCVTNNELLAKRLQMIRNHAEAIVGPANINDLNNMIGFNYRMTEMSAAVGLVQLENIEKHVSERKYFAEQLTSKTKDIDFLHTPKVRKGCNHVYYNWALKYDSEKLGVSRDMFVKALNHEGLPCSSGYVEPLYMLPTFQNRKAFGNSGYPFTLTNRKYYYNMCPIGQKLFENEFIMFEMCAYKLSDNLIDKFGNIFHKIIDNKKDLIDFEKETSN